MPKIPRPELSLDWWKDVKPANVRGRDLEKALNELEKAEKACARDPSATRDMAKAVKTLSRAVTRTKRECDDDADEDVIDALGDLIELAEERLEELESEGGGPLFDVQRLRELMRKLKKTPMAFAVGLGTGETTYFTLDQYKKGLQLMTKLKQASSCGLATYGIASAEGKELCLEVQGPSLSGLKKRLREFLRDNQPLPFQNVRVEGKKRKSAADEGDSPGGKKAQADAALVAKKIAQAVSRKRKKVEQEVVAALERLREVERSAGRDAARRAAELRKALEERRSEGREGVQLVKDTAEALLEEKSQEALEALERAARGASRSLDEIRKTLAGGHDWLESEAP